MNNNIDNPSLNDNRNYDYSNINTKIRDEYSMIIPMVNPNSKVIDLGCGNGTLLNILKKDKNIIPCGMELSDSGVEICKQDGLNVIKGRIDERLPFEDNSFDYAICNVTIQMVMYPEVLLSEMKRISKYQIISFPNFGFYKNRLELLFKGQMPEISLFGYKWYNTGHIHQLSKIDFESLIKVVGGLKIKSIEMLKPKSKLKWFFIKLFPNLFQILFVYKLEKDETN